MSYYEIELSTEDVKFAIREYLKFRRRQANAIRIETIRQLTKPPGPTFLNRNPKPRCANVRDAIQYMKSNSTGDWWSLCTIWEEADQSGSKWDEICKDLLQIIERSNIKSTVKLGSDLAFLAAWVSK